MSELCNFKARFYSLFISDLILSCSYILSHPLYFSYFIFFSPYIAKIVHFLSPLIVTTFVLFLVLITGIVSDDLSPDLGYAYVLEVLPFREDYEGKGFQGLEDFGVYEILFGKCLMIGLSENPDEIMDEKLEGNQGSGLIECLDKKDSIFGEKEGFKVDDNKVEKNQGPVSKLLEDSSPAMEEKRLENFLKILNEFERMSCNVEEKKKIEPSSHGAKIGKTVEKPKMGPPVKIGSKAVDDDHLNNDDAAKVVVGVDISNGEKECNTPTVKAHSQRIRPNVVDQCDGGHELESSFKVESFRTWDCNNFGSFGSMRKEKEWKRTLACKLFEERHNVDGGEGMDSLWEAYEIDSSKSKNDKKKKKNKNKSEVEVNEEDDDEEVVDGQLCCLQAIKLSTGKMNIGIGRPNLVKISKAIKGFGWLHHVSKHSKKVHNNGDR